MTGGGFIGTFKSLRECSRRSSQGYNVTAIFFNCSASAPSWGAISPWRKTSGAAVAGAQSRFWERMFGGDPGYEPMSSTTNATIIGVIPPDFGFHNCKANRRIPTGGAEAPTEFHRYQMRAGSWGLHWTLGRRKLNKRLSIADAAG